jgi:hypothetical protein
MKKILCLLMAFSFVAMAGTGSGGGTPPAREKLEQILKTNLDIEGGLFDNGIGDVSILSRVKLQPQLLVSGGGFGGNPPAVDGEYNNQTLRFSKEDIEFLKSRTKPVDAIGAEGENQSFTVEAGESLDSVLLKSRRASARESVKN